jgi:hypothetical protein
MPLALAEYIVDLSGETILLPPAWRVPGKVTIYARRPCPAPDRILVESLEFEATRVIRPIGVQWPDGPFRCDRAEYVDGELRFHLGENAFGFGVNGDNDVISLAGEVDRDELENGGITGAINQLASEQGLSEVSLDAHYMTPPVDVALELPSAAETAEVELLDTQPAAWAGVWVPSPVTGVLFAILAIALGYFAGVDLASGDPILSYLAAIVSVVLFLYGMLGIIVPHDYLQRLMWATTHPHVPSWGLRVMLLIAGIGIAALGFVMAGRGAAAKSPEPGLIGLLLMAAAAVLIGYNVTRLIPPAD